MENAYLSPYLNFDNNCEEAMKFYQSILGGDLEINKFGDSPMPDAEKYKDLVLHASLDNGRLSFMASDSPHAKVVVGNNIHMSIAGLDEELIRAYFEGLSAGGKVDMPMEKQFWGDTFGMLTDKFGVHWMVNISSGDEKTV